MPRACGSLPGRMRAAHLVKATGVVLLAAFALAAATGPSGAAGGYTGPARHKPRLTLSVKKQKIAKARRTGLKVKARCNVACAVTVFAYRKQSLLGRGTKRLPSRSGTVKVKFTKAGKR
ncbi:MAG: hypothetical protein QOI80_3618, partial [Solirubrobacteraceae bacterium]|nr:hypothetical protein [Solirubrobacteraceae bacterium]